MKLEQIPAGTIVNAHGVRGEVRVLPRPGREGLLTSAAALYVDGAAVKPEHVRRHKSFVLLKLPGVDDMDAALAWKGKPVSVPRPAGAAYFDEELPGVEVYDCETGTLLGTVTAVEPYPAASVCTVEGDRTYRFPLVPGAFVQAVDVEQNRMDVRVWEGMADDEPGT